MFIFKPSFIYIREREGWKLCELLGDLFTWCDADPGPGTAREAVMLPIVGQIFVAVR